MVTESEGVGYQDTIQSSGSRLAEAFPTAFEQVSRQQASDPQWLILFF